ncbi:MAG: betaine/proline/choline family ABC transporter ATP-binding protein [Rhodobacteraceae bacterium]|nr:betaine/proline/choline family ABC transporter ATP-binding protein [Paracoccaceae bacterium]
MSEPMIVCRGVWKIFGPDAVRMLETHDRSLSRAETEARTGHIIAVKDASFRVAKGECFVVMGLSGSGKSTLVRCLTRLIEPTDGKIMISGQDVTRMSRRALLTLRRNKVAMVFQHFGLFPHRKVLENISYGLEVRGVGLKDRLAKAAKILDLVGLGGWGDRYPRELSGGMQQRVGLARALAVDPEILIFDEPFSALDPLIRRDMQNELLELQNRLQKTLVFITHDFPEAIRMGDRIAIMKDGEIVQTGTSEDIVANPADSYVADFTEDVPRYKVLSAGTVMRPTALSDPGTAPVRSSDRIDSLINRLADADSALPVVDDGGAVVGEIDASIVMKAMQTTPGPALADGADCAKAEGPGGRQTGSTMIGQSAAKQSTGASIPTPKRQIRLR